MDAGRDGLLCHGGSVVELEEFISGYCRERDGSRTVLLEGVAGDYTADCSYGSCPHEPTCPIAQRILQMMEEYSVV